MPNIRKRFAGGVRSRGQGRWQLRLVYDDPLTGERQANYKTVEATSAARAMALYEAWKLEMAQSPRTSSRRAQELRFGELGQEWLEERQERVKDGSLAPATLRNDRDFYRHAVAKWGTWRVDALVRSEARAEIREWFRWLRAGSSGSGLAETTAEGVARIPGAILRWAMTDRDPLLSLMRNPFAGYRRPRAKAVWVPVIYGQGQMEALRQAAAQEPLTYAPVMTIAATGMRIGEVAGLRDEAVSSDGLEVVGQRRTNDRRIATDLHLPRIEYSEVKNRDAGRRTLALTTSIRDAIGFAQRLKAEFAASGETESWHDDGFLFCDERGRPLEPRRLRAALYRAQDRARLPRAHPHDFRKRVTTLLMRHGVSPKVVANWNGHSVRTALLFYEQVEREDLQAAAAGLEQAEAHAAMPTTLSHLLDRVRLALIKRGVADVDALMAEVGAQLPPFINETWAKTLATSSR